MSSTIAKSSLRLIRLGLMLFGLLLPAPAFAESIGSESESEVSGEDVTEFLSLVEDDRLRKRRASCLASTFSSGTSGKRPSAIVEARLVANLDKHGHRLGNGLLAPLRC